MRSVTCFGRIRHAALVALTVLALPAHASAGEKEIDVKISREVVVGTTRVVLLRVDRITEFTEGAEGKPPRIVRSLRFVVMREDLEKAIETVASSAAVFAAGTSNRAMQGPNESTFQNDAYPGKLPTSSKLPKVNAVDRAVITSVSFEGDLTAKNVDLSFKVGLRKGDDRSVLFKNIPLE